MPGPERSVLHVLPHPGGGGETYVDAPERDAGIPVRSRLPRARARLLRRPSSARGVVEAHAARASATTSCTSTARSQAGSASRCSATRPSVVTLHGLHLVRRVRGLRETAAALNLRAVLRAADRTICVRRASTTSSCRVVGPACRAACGRRSKRRSPSGSRRARSERAEVRAELGHRRVGGPRDLGRLARRAQGSAHRRPRRGTS